MTQNEATPEPKGISESPAELIFRYCDDLIILKDELMEDEPLNEEEMTEYITRYRNIFCEMLKPIEKEYSGIYNIFNQISGGELKSDKYDNDLEWISKSPSGDGGTLIKLKVIPAQDWIIIRVNDYRRMNNCNLYRHYNEEEPGSRQEILIYVTKSGIQVKEQLHNNGITPLTV